MNNSSLKNYSTTRSFLNKFHSGKEGIFLDRLIPEERTKIETLDLQYKPSSLTFIFPASWLQKIHYSWFLPLIEKSSPFHQRLYLASLSTPQAKSLADLLKQPIPKKRLSLPLRLYLQTELKKKIVPSDILPEELLPESDANRLLELSKPSLLTLIDYLGIFDLAGEVKQIVDKRVIEKVAAALTDEEIKILQFAKNQPVKGISLRFDLSSWDGSRKNLVANLHKKGLERLAKALFDQSPSLIWNLTHKLDEGRGNVVLQHLKSKQEIQLASFFRKQLLQLIERISL